MERERRTWRLEDLSPGQRYDLLANLVVPRPIAFVSTLSPGGVANLAPFSFFTVGGVTPPSLVFCPVRGKEGAPKASLANIEATGEFVVNLLDRPMADGMNECGVDYEPGVSKWGLSGFTPIPSLAVKPERVAESRAQFECRLHAVVHHGTGPGAASYVIGEVLLAHVEPQLFDGTSQPETRFHSIARLGGSEYIDLDGGKLFVMPRPKGPARPSSG